jgi:hypothetical protein
VGPALFLGYLPALATAVLAVWFSWDRIVLKRRGLRTLGKKTGTADTDNGLLIVFAYQDHEERARSVRVPARYVPKKSTVIKVVFDPRKPDRAMAVADFHRHFWQTGDGRFAFVPLGLAAFYTLALPFTMLAG